MHITFVESSLFTRLLGQHLSDDEYIVLQKSFASKPGTGKVISGSGGLRVIYYWYTSKKRIYLLPLYYKGGTADLSARDKAVLKQLMDVWKNEQT